MEATDLVFDKQESRLHPRTGRPVHRIAVRAILTRPLWIVEDVGTGEIERDVAHRAWLLLREVTPLEALAWAAEG